MKSVLVVIVSYNAMKWVEHCLLSLASSAVPLDVLMIDNGSTDGTCEFVKKTFPNITLTEMSDNLGFAAGNNIGIRKAISDEYKYVFLLNQDTWILPNTVSNLINEIEKDSKIGVVSPVQLNGKGDELDKNFNTYITANNMADLEVKGQAQASEKVEFVNAAAWLIPVSAVKQIGGFDPIFPHYGEDRDFCNRLKYHGFSVRVVYHSIIHHDREYASSNPFRKRYNLLFTMGLAHLKNINFTLAENFKSWKKWRSRKIIRTLIVLDFEGFKAELIVQRDLKLMAVEIERSRVLSTSLNGPYLS
jgi:GT2 family glycosyltransferase